MANYNEDETLNSGRFALSNAVKCDHFPSCEIHGTPAIGNEKRIEHIEARENEIISLTEFGCSSNPILIYDTNI